LRFYTKNYGIESVRVTAKLKQMSVISLTLLIYI